MHKMRKTIGNSRDRNPGFLAPQATALTTWPWLKKIKWFQIRSKFQAPTALGRNLRRWRTRKWKAWKDRTWALRHPWKASRCTTATPSSPAAWSSRSTPSSTSSDPKKTKDKFSEKEETLTEIETDTKKMNRVNRTFLRNAKKYKWKHFLPSRAKTKASRLVCSKFFAAEEWRPETRTHQYQLFRDSQIIVSAEIISICIVSVEVVDAIRCPSWQQLCKHDQSCQSSAEFVSVRISSDVTSDELDNNASINVHHTTSVLIASVFLASILLSSLLMSSKLISSVLFYQYLHCWCLPHQC